MKKMGFTLAYLEDGTVKGTLNIKENVQCPETSVTEEKSQAQNGQKEHKESEAAKA
jgi:hypothetical protein